MTAAPTTANAPAAYLTPECRVGRLNPTFRHGCPTCPAPGYQHPVLGWVKVECACPHHAEEATS